MLGQLALGQAGAQAVKCQDNWCWAVPAESVLVLEHDTSARMTGAGTAATRLG